MTTTTLERDVGVETLKQANAIIQQAIEESKGRFVVKMEVCVFPMLRNALHIVCQFTLFVLLLFLSLPVLSLALLAE